MNKLLRIVSVLMLLIISRFVFAETIPATKALQQYFTYYDVITLQYSITHGFVYPGDRTSACKLVAASLSTSIYGGSVAVPFFKELAGATGCLVGYNTTDSKGVATWQYSTQYNLSITSSDSYTCSSGYYLSDSAGVQTSSGQYCTTDKSCSELAASGGSVLGSGQFIAGTPSSLCVQANSTTKCAAVNTGSSLYFSTVSDTCSVGMAAGTNFYYSGASCETVGSLSNNYPDLAAATAACASPSTTKDPATPPTDTANTDPGAGCATITDGDTTLTKCATSTDTGSTTKDTTTTANTDTTKSTDTTTTGGNTYTTNNNTTTNNNSSSSSVTNNYGSDSNSDGTDSDSITTASTVTADYKDAIPANDWSSRNYSTVLEAHVSELKSSQIYSTASSFFTVSFSGGNCQPWGGTFEIFGYSFTLNLDVCSFIAPYGVWMASVVIFVCSFFAYRIAME